MPGSTADTLRAFKSISGFVLAGGACTRIGRPKALLLLEGRTMLERQVRLLRIVTGKVFVAGWPADIPASRLPKNICKVAILPDEPIGQGPLSGIY